MAIRPPDCSCLSSTAAPHCCETAVAEKRPSATYFPQATDLKFSFMLLGWSSGTGEASSPLKALLATYSKDKGFGTANRGRYSNPKMDALLEEALATVDDARRAQHVARDRRRINCAPLGLEHVDAQ